MVKIWTMRIGPPDGNAKIHVTDEHQRTMKIYDHDGQPSERDHAPYQRAAEKFITQTQLSPTNTALACQGPLTGWTGYKFTIVDYTVCWTCKRTLNDPHNTVVNDGTPQRFIPEDYGYHPHAGPDLIVCLVCYNDSTQHTKAQTTTERWWNAP